MSARRCLPLAASLLFAALSLGGCASDEERKAEHLARAEQLLAAGDQEGGLIELRSALQLAPQDADICLRIAEALVETGADTDAIFFYSEASRLDPSNDAALLGEAKLLLFNDAKRSGELIDAVLARSPENALAHARRSELALVAVDTAKARSEALMAVELAPDDVFVRMQLGIVRRAELREQKLRGTPPEDSLYRAAIEAFEQAAELAKRDPTARFLDRAVSERAVTYSTWPGHEAEALRAYREACDAVLAAPLPVRRKVHVLAAAGSFAETQGDAELERWALERVVELAPKQLQPWSRLADLEGRQGRSGSKLLESLLAKRPDDARAHALYARRLDAEGSHEEATAYLKKVSGELEEPWAALRTLAEFQIAASDFAGARAVVERLEKERPQDSQTQLLSAQLAVAERRFPDAQNTLRKLVGQDERNLAAHRLLAEVELRHGDPQRAVAALRKTIELAGGVPAPDLLRVLARAEGRARNWTAVRAVYQQLFRAHGPLRPEETVTLARALYELGEAELARQGLERVLALPEPPAGAALLYSRREGAKDPARARRLLEQAAARNAGREAVVRELVRLDAKEGKVDAALARLAEADSPQARLLRARLLASANRDEEATREVQQLLETDPESGAALGLLTLLLKKQGRVDQAIQALEDTVKAGHAKPAQRVLLGRMLVERGNRARAIELFEGVLKERSDLPGVKNDLAFLIAAEGGDLRRSLELAREARAARPDLAEFADTLGYVYLRLEMSDAAVDQLRGAVELARPGTPVWATAQFHLGLALKQAGRKEEATQALEKALAAAIEFPEADDARRELRALSEEGSPRAPS